MTLLVNVQPVISFTTVVLSVRFTKLPLVNVPPSVPLACVSLKIAIAGAVGLLAANVKLSLSELAVKTSPATYVVNAIVSDYPKTFSASSTPYSTSSKIRTYTTVVAAV